MDSSVQRLLPRPILPIAGGVVLLLVIACGEDPSEIRATGTDGEASRQLSVQDTATASLSSRHASLVRRLRAVRPAWSVGTLDGPPETRWGLPIDAEIGTRGRLFVLDAQNVEVRVFDSEGEYLGSFLRDGSGPLEMREPKGIELLADDSLLVYSVVEGRVVPTDPLDTAHEARRLAFSGSVQDLCVGDSAWLARVMTGRREGPLERVNRTGEVERIFGHAHDHEERAVRAQLSMGMLECVDRPPRVLGATNDGPVIRAYSLEGDSSWTAEVAEFQPPEIRQIQVGGRPGISRPGERPHDRVLSLVDVTDEAVLVQVARVGAPVVERGSRRWPIERFDSFLVSARTGDGVYVGSDLGHVLAATESRLVVVDQDDTAGVYRLVSLDF